jgi:hypothetical protein
MKYVPNLISYIHEVFRNFSQFLAIYFELFSSGVNFFYFGKQLMRGASSQRQCRAVPCPDWLPWVALSGHACGGLNAS